MPVPAVLLSPPWEAKRPKTKTAAARLVAPEIADTIVWGPHGKPSVPWGIPSQRSPQLDAELLAKVERTAISYVELFDATNETMLAILETRPDRVGGYAEGLRYLLARLGAPAIPFVRRAFEAAPFDALPHLAALRSAAIAPAAAEAWHKKKKLKEDGGRWLLRHAEVAALALFPLAAGKAGRARDAALAALGLLEKEEPTAFASALAHYGDEAARAWGAARSEAAATGAPEKAPAAPSFLAELSAPELVSGGALPEAAMKNLCGILALAPHPRPPRELSSIAEACTAASLATFARSLFEGWQRAGLPREHGYAARAAIHLGDDALVTDAADAADEWASTGGYARAVWIIEALAEHATDTALAELDELARRARSAGLRAGGESIWRAFAGERGITRDDLADALGPELGIGAAFGDEGHVLALDGEQLVLVLPNGQRTREPRGEAAKKAFSALAKTARTTLSRQRARLEAAMLEGRTWPASSFTTLALHPVLGTLARRVVWVATSSGSARAVRVAEDGSLADAADTHVALDPSGSLHVAHPIELGDDVARFRALMGDYRVVEPFAQLAREVFVPSLSDVALDREHVVAAERLAGVARRAWTAGEVEEGGYIHVLSRTVRGATATMALEPGLVVGSWASSSAQTIVVTLSAPASACPVLYSEVCRDLAAIVAGGS